MSVKGTICSVDPFFAEKKIFANIFVYLDRGKFVRKVDDLTGIISNHMHIKSQEITIQKFPPFQRILLEIQNK